MEESPAIEDFFEFPMDKDGVGHYPIRLLTGHPPLKSLAA